MTATATATYTVEGRLSVDGSPIGIYDADGGEWLAPVDDLLGEAGWVRTGDWDGDDAPVERVIGLSR